MSTGTVAKHRDIDGYVAALDRALSGPRRAKRSLLVEARDSLVDATEAYERAGLDGPSAERRAVEDFGGIDEIAPGYRTELGLAQSRQTIVVVLATLALQTVVWDHSWPLLPEPGVAPDGSLVRLVNTGVESSGAVVLFAALTLLLGARVGARRPRLGAHLARVTGVFGWVVGVYLVTSAVLLSSLGMAVSDTPWVTAVAPLAVFIVLPVAGVVGSARRCLAFAA